MRKISERSNKAILEKKENELVESLVHAIQSNDEVLLEGIISTIIGGTLGFTVGPMIVKALMKVLGISKDGLLYQVFTSKAVTTAIGAVLANKGK